MASEAQPQAAPWRKNNNIDFRSKERPLQYWKIMPFSTPITRSHTGFAACSGASTSHRPDTCSQLASLCRSSYAIARHSRRSPAMLSIVFQPIAIWLCVGMASYHDDLPAASTHMSTHRRTPNPNIGSFLAATHCSHANMTSWLTPAQRMMNDTLRCSGYFFTCGVTRTDRRVSFALIGIRCCYVVEVIHQEQESATDIFSPSYL